jgi:uncharacterized protein (TIGR00251 family)
MKQVASSFSVKVIPGARRTEITGIMADGSIKIKLNAKPIEGKANVELFEFLSDKLQVQKSNISILKGQRSRQKVIRVSGINQNDLQVILEKMIGDQDP